MKFSRTLITMIGLSAAWAPVAQAADVAIVGTLTSALGEPTHKAEWGKGGWRLVANAAALAALSANLIEEGSVAWVANEDKEYQWTGAAWVEHGLPRILNDDTWITTAGHALNIDGGGTGDFRISDHADVSINANDISLDGNVKVTATPATDNTNLKVLARDPVSFKVEEVEVSAIAGGGGAAGGYAPLMNWSGFSTSASPMTYELAEVNTATDDMVGQGLRAIGAGGAPGRLKVTFLYPKGSTSWSTTDAIEYVIWSSTGGSVNSQISKIEIHAWLGDGDKATIYDSGAVTIQPTTADTPQRFTIDDSALSDGNIYDYGTIEFTVDLAGSGEEYLYLSILQMNFD